MPSAPGKNGKERKEQLAVALADLERLPPAFRMKMMAGRLDLSQILKLGTDRKEPTASVAFKCDLLAAAIICDMLRHYDRKAGDTPTQMYIKRNEWTRIPNYVTLTVTSQEGKVQLNPQVFREEVEVIEAVPLPVGRIGRPENS